MSFNRPHKGFTEPRTYLSHKYGVPLFYSHTPLATFVHCRKSSEVFKDLGLGIGSRSPIGFSTCTSFFQKDDASSVGNHADLGYYKPKQVVGLFARVFVIGSRSWLVLTLGHRETENPHTPDAEKT